MSLFIETIRLLDGELKNLQFHQERFERTRYKKLGIRKHPLLEKLIRIPGGLENGLLKCRLIYGKEVMRIEFEPYERRDITCLKLVGSDTISYDHKFADRGALDELFRLRGLCDDILIVKKGCITDSYYANVVFWDGENWFTPHNPLLNGTMRALLLNRGELKTERITPENLGKYIKIKLINALNDLNEGPEIPVDAVKY